MKALLDTNILIEREKSIPGSSDIGKLFRWLEKMGYERCVHQLSIEEISRYHDRRVVESFKVKLESYTILQTVAPLHADLAAMFSSEDNTENKQNDTRLLNEIYQGRCSILLTEDRGLIHKARRIGIAEKVYTAESFLEYVVAEKPDLLEYRVPTVQRKRIGELDYDQTFFDSFRSSYPHFNEWLNKKAEEYAYICEVDGLLKAFLYLKVEETKDVDRQISPLLPEARYLKIGTLKVELNGLKLGERFIKIVFDNAMRLRVDAIYVTLHEDDEHKGRLVNLIETFGFEKHGTKRSNAGIESVYCRNIKVRPDYANPSLTYPVFSSNAKAYLVAIYPEYHTSLFPDSILNNESTNDFKELYPHRNAIRKVFLSRSIVRELEPGSVIAFYRTGGKYAGVVTTIGIVEAVRDSITSFDELREVVGSRSVFQESKLREFWDYKPASRPFVVKFLHVYSLPRRPNLDELIRESVVASVSDAPRGFTPISTLQLQTILKLANADFNYLVD